MLLSFQANPRRVQRDTEAEQRCEFQSQQILLIPLCSGMQEGKVTEADRDPEEH